MTNSLCSSGDTLSREAIHDLYSTQARELWAIFYAKSSDHSVADDVLSEAFARLLAHDGEHIRNPRAWLLHVGKNLLIDHVRREKRFRTSSISGHASARQATPSQDFLLCEVRDLVRDCLRDLYLDYRLVLVLRYGLGYSTKRISLMMEHSVAAVDMKLSRARRKLAEALIDRGINHASDLIMESRE